MTIVGAIHFIFHFYLAGVYVNLLFLNSQFDSVGHMFPDMSSRMYRAIPLKSWYIIAKMIYVICASKAGIIENPTEAFKRKLEEQNRAPLDVELDYHAEAQRVRDIIQNGENISPEQKKQLLDYLDDIVREYEDKVNNPEENLDVH